jgi:hypothetical protein
MANFYLGSISYLKSSQRYYLGGFISLESLLLKPNFSKCFTRQKIGNQSIRRELNATLRLTELFKFMASVTY